MAIEITPHFVELVYHAAWRSFWRHAALKNFLRGVGIKDSFLATHSKDETKRQFLDRLFVQLQKTDAGRRALFRMATALVDQRAFPDLENWEDSEEKLREARKAVQRLQSYMDDQAEEQKSEKERAEARKRHLARQERARQSRVDLDKLNEQLVELAGSIGQQEGGYAFESWFFQLADYCEVHNRRPYRHGGRQIDGSITVSGTTYLVELKFTADPVGPEVVDSLHKKVTSKADNTMGVLISMSGFTRAAVDEASGPRTPLLLLDHAHLYLVLNGVMALDEVVDRVRRHASQTGDALLPAASFG